MTQRSRSWRSVMWREWRDCADDVVTSHLGELLFEERITWGGVARATAFWAALAAPMVTFSYFAEKGMANGGDPVIPDLPEHSLLAFSIMYFAIPTMCVGLLRLCGRTWRAWFNAWGVAAAPVFVISGIFLVILAVVVPVLVLMSMGAPNLRLPEEQHSFSLVLIPLSGFLVLWGAALGFILLPSFTIACLCCIVRTDAGSSTRDLSASVARRLPLGWGASTTREDVQQAVAQAAKEKGHGPWCCLFESISQAIEPGRNLEELASALRQDDWVERYAARFGIVGAGGRAVPALRPLLQQKGDRPVRKSAVGLVREIAQRTRDRLGYRAFGLACPEHLVRCHPHRQQVSSRSSVTYYGCRACHQSREFLECPEGIVAVLDTGTQEAVAHHGGALRVNWLSFGKLFDFDRVEIVHAADEDVERFMVQVGNDTDPVRCARYGKMRCVVSPDCRLSEITRRVLQDTFQRVVHKKRSSRGAAR